MNNNSHPIFTLENVGIKYGRRFSLKKRSNERWVLRHANLSVYPGESVGVTGGNGAGKSTLLRVIAGIIDPNEGKIVKNTNLRVGLLSLNSGFNPYLSGRDNIILKGLYLGVSKKFITSQVDHVIELSGIKQSIDNMLCTYSSGMIARLGFSVNYICAPDIILIDEVLGVGDKEFKEKSRSMIKDLVQSNRTVVIVSHDTSTLNKLCDRIINISEGLIN